MKAAFFLALILAASPAIGNDDPLGTARDLYASAAYEEALSELARVSSERPAAAVALEADAYRVFCFVALGRNAEAEATAEGLLRKDPLFTVDQYRDSSPRVVAMFDAVRRRVLPLLIREEFRAARAGATEQPPDVEARLARVREMLAQAQKTGTWDETLADLRVLVDGFLALSRASGSAMPAAPPVSESSQPAAPAVAVAAPVQQPAARAAVPSGTTQNVFRAGDQGIVPPVILSQEAPAVPLTILEAARRVHRNGSIDVVINERGTVDDVIVTQSVHAAYDARVAAAARKWKYRPAMKDGVPVRFIKTVVISTNEQ